MPVSIRRRWPTNRPIRIKRLPWQPPTTEAGCARLLSSLRNDLCAHCEGPRTFQLPSRPRYRECSDCGRQYSVLSGTPLHGCRVPLRKILVALRLLTRPASISSAALSRAIQCTWRTAWTLSHRIRAALEASLAPLDASQVTLTHEMSVPLRADHGEDPESQLFSWQRRAWLYCAQDLEGHLRAGVGAQHRLTRQAFLDRVAPGIQAFEIVKNQRTVRHIVRILRGTHRCVSRRWVPRYVVLACWLARPRGYLACLTLARLVLQGPRRSLARLPPTPHAPRALTGA